MPARAFEKTVGGMLVVFERAPGNALQVVEVGGGGGVKVGFHALLLMSKRAPRRRRLPDRSPLPCLDPQLRRQVQRLARLDVGGQVPGVQIAHGGRAAGRRRVAVGQDVLARGRFARFAAPAPGLSDQKGALGLEVGRLAGARRRRRRRVGRHDCAQHQGQRGQRGFGSLAQAGSGSGGHTGHIRRRHRPAIVELNDGKRHTALFILERRRAKKCGAHCQGPDRSGLPLFHAKKRRPKKDTFSVHLFCINLKIRHIVH